MTPFDSVRTRELAARLLASEQTAERASYLPDAVGNAAVLGLDSAVTAWIAGFEDQARPVVARCREWLEDSIARDERFGDPPAYFAARRCEALALARWLTDGEDPLMLWREGLQLHERAWDELPGEHREPGFMREHYLADFARAGHDARECEHVLKVCAGFDVRPVATAAELRTELDVALWACAERSGNELLEAGARVLRRSLGEWLSRGDGVRAAAWLKLVVWATGGASSPSATLAYGWTLVAAS